jgi:hypothetical protein
VGRLEYEQNDLRELIAKRWMQKAMIEKVRRAKRRVSHMLINCWS